jgi:hypothetical protein
MRRISCVLCALLALLTVLSIVPVFLLFWVSKFSWKVAVHSFAYAMAFPGEIRTLAIVLIFGPFPILLAYVFAFLYCHKARDVLDRTGRRFG